MGSEKKTKERKKKRVCVTFCPLLCTKCAWYVCPYGHKQAQMVRSQEVLQCHITLSQIAVIASGPEKPKGDR